MSDTFHRTDPLLLAGKALTIIMQAVMGLAALAVMVSLPAILLFRSRIDGQITELLGADAAASFPLLHIVALLLLTLVLLAAGCAFFDKLRRIIGTVGEGDPFVPENASRLSAMAWLALAAQCVLLPMAAIGVVLLRWASEHGQEAHTALDASLDPTGILLVIVLFILARVFRQGAAMREDLEGTV